MQAFLRYEVVDLAVLEPFNGNARRHNDATLNNSVKAHGQYRTLVARELDGGTLQLLAGHGTADALKARGIDKARVEILSCSDEEALAINMVDNRTGDLAFYDDDALQAQLEQVRDLDLWEATGWDEKAAEKYLDPKEQGGIPEDTPTYGVLISCDTEEEQAELLERFAGEGLTVRALMG